MELGYDALYAYAQTSLTHGSAFFAPAFDLTFAAVQTSRLLDIHLLGELSIRRSVRLGADGYNMTDSW